MPTSAFRRVVRCGPLASALVALACAPARAATQCPGARGVPYPTVSAADVSALECVVNRERERRGRRALRRVSALDQAAAGHAGDMVRRNFFDHRSPGGATPADRARQSGYTNGARAWRVGENIAWGTGRLGTPERVVGQWLRSPGHRRILLDPRFTDLGLGIAAGAPGASGASGATYALLVGASHR